MVDAAIQLAEGGQCGGAHPYDQVLILVAIVAGVR